jgi:hypothetical protein
LNSTPRACEKYSAIILTAVFKPSIKAKILGVHPTVEKIAKPN